jgi:transposase-like protein
MAWLPHPWMRALRAMIKAERMMTHLDSESRAAYQARIFPNDAAITRLVGAMMLEQNDDCSLNRRYMQLEGLQTLSDTAPTRMSAVPG